MYSIGYWTRTVLDHYVGQNMIDVTDNEIWYGSTDTEDDGRYVIISTYKGSQRDHGIHSSVRVHSRRHILCMLRTQRRPIRLATTRQDGTTIIIQEIDYSDLHPELFHVREALGLFTECTGFGTNFKTATIT